jgi:hypothetical protein
MILYATSGVLRHTRSHCLEALSRLAGIFGLSRPPFATQGAKNAPGRCGGDEDAAALAELALDVVAIGQSGPEAIDCGVCQSRKSEREFPRL